MTSVVNRDIFSHYVVVVPDDTTPYTDGQADALYVGGAGDVAAVRADGTAVVISAVAAGSILPLKTIRVNVTLTTATLMVALYTRVRL